jgi:D-threo-aldose 1-dehydrogenase
VPLEQFLAAKAHMLDGATHNYGETLRALLERVLRLRRIAEAHGVALRAAALAFPFGPPAVASVLVGGRSAAEVHDAAELLSLPCRPPSGRSCGPRAY